MLSTNVNGLMYVTYSVLNHGMMARKTGSILNITSVTGLEVPPFPGEAVYHSSKAAQEAFTNSLRNELVGTNIKVLALRPGVVATNFHAQRVGHDDKLYDSFIEGYEYVGTGKSVELRLILPGPLSRMISPRRHFICSTSLHECLSRHWTWCHLVCTYHNLVCT